MRVIDDMLDTVICGDCLEVMRGMEDGCIDAIVADPPYGTELLGGGYGRRQLHDIGDGKGRVIANDENLHLLTDAYPEFRRLIGEGWAAVFFSARKTPDFIDATSRKEWFGKVIWDKGQPGLGYHIRYAHEDIAVFQYGSPTKPPVALLSVIRDTTPRDARHPHAKPTRLLSRIIEWACPPGGVVLDPFFGIGGVGVAAVRMGRRFIGIEINPDYCKIAEKRIQEERDKYALLEGCGSE